MSHTLMIRRAASTAGFIALLALCPAAALAQVPGDPAAPPPPPPPIAQPMPPPPVEPPQPQPAPEPASPGGQNRAPMPPVDASRLSGEIKARMDGNAFGYQYAVAQRGTYIGANSGGYARSKADDVTGPDIDDSSVLMQPTMRYEIASLTKNFTAVATMKLLRAHHLSIGTSVDAWLPKSWTRGPGFKTKDVTFYHLLSHTSGISQMLGALPKGTGPTNNGWDAMRFVVAQGVVPGSARTYKNANYALLRIANAYMWKALGGNPVPHLPAVPVSKLTHSAYALDYLRRHVLAPAGIQNVLCSTSNGSTVGLNYDKGTKQTMKGALMTTTFEECAGARGLRLNAIDIVRHLSHLRYGTIVHPDDLATMDELELGWDQKAPNAWPGTFWHAGDLLPGNNAPGPQLHTCGVTFADGTAASLIVNSPLVSGSACGVLRAAWKAAVTPA